jgi:hypothetical protein
VHRRPGPSASSSSATTTTSTATRASLHTPASVHYGTATEVRAKRALTLDAANRARSRYCRPSPPKLPMAAWINKPTIESDARKNG